MFRTLSRKRLVIFGIVLVLVLFFCLILLWKMNATTHESFTENDSIPDVQKIAEHPSEEASAMAPQRGAGGSQEASAMAPQRGAGESQEASAMAPQRGAGGSQEASAMAPQRGAGGSQEASNQSDGSDPKMSTFLTPTEQKVTGTLLEESSSSKTIPPKGPPSPQEETQGDTNQVSLEKGFKKTFSSFVNHSSIENKKYQIILARYQENINYVLTSYFREFDIVIYNKGDEIQNHDIRERCTIIDLPNVGKCDHTYLYHIIENYDKLYDVTVFLPASFYHLHYKRFRAMQIMKQVQDTGDSVFPCEMIQAVDLKYRHYVEMSRNRNVLDLEYYFKMDKYETSYEANKNATVDKNMLHSPLRPFHKWYKKHFPKKNCPYLFYWGMFAVSRKDIRKNKIHFYRELCAYLDHHPNPEVGHYMERSWASIFYPFHKKCILQNH